MEKDLFFKVIGVILVLIVGTISAVLLERMGDLQTNVGALSASVERISELDDLEDRIYQLEGGEMITPHAQLSSAVDQYPNEEGESLQMELVDSLSNLDFDHRRDPTTITIQEAGSYLFLIAPQVRRYPLAETQVCFTAWLRVNGKDLENSAVEECWAAGTDWQTTSVLMLQAILPMDEGDQVQVMIRSLPEGKSGAVAIKHEGVPLVPAAIVSIVRI